MRDSDFFFVDATLRRLDHNVEIEPLKPVENTPRSLVSSEVL